MSRGRRKPKREFAEQVDAKAASGCICTLGLIQVVKPHSSPVEMLSHPCPKCRPIAYGLACRGEGFREAIEAAASSLEQAASEAMIEPDGQFGLVEAFPSLATGYFKRAAAIVRSLRERAAET